MTLGKQDSDLGQGGSSGVGKRWTCPGHVLKVELTGLSGQWHTGCERKRLVRDGVRALSPASQKLRWGQP